MASNATTSMVAPSNFYLRNPIALLVGKDCLKDVEDDDIVQTQLRLSTDNASKGRTGSSATESKESDVPAFIQNDTPAKQLVLELASLLDASQLKKCEDSDGGASNDGANATAALNGAKRHTPYQILYSNTFQCYTSLAFYGALLAQLKAWVRALDAGSARSRSLVWSHLFCLVGSDQVSSDPITPVLQAIVSAPKMDLMDVELLYLAVLLATKLYPQLLTSSASSSAAATPEPSTTSVSSPPSASTASSLASTSVSATAGADSLSSSAPADSVASGSPNPETAMDVDKLAAGAITSSNGSVDNKSSSESVPKVATTLVSSKGSAFSATAAANLSNPHSKEVVQANSIAFYQYYRSRVVAAHEKVIAQVSAQRRLVMASLGGNPSSAASAAAVAASISAPSQNDLILALALRHLASLNAWSGKLEKLSKTPSEFASVAAAVQTVPALRNALSLDSTSTFITSPTATTLGAGASSSSASAPSLASSSSSTSAAAATTTAAPANPSSNPSNAPANASNEDATSATNNANASADAIPSASSASTSSPLATVNNNAPSAATADTNTLGSTTSPTATTTVNNPFATLLALWNSAPRKHLASISALYNAISMLKDFGLLSSSEFVGVKFDDVLALASSIAGSPATVNPAVAAMAAAAAAAAAANPMASPLTSATWGSSPLPAWSPVPSPLTTFPGPYGSLSPITFVARASPLSLGAASSSSNTTFSSVLPQGTLLARPSSSGGSVTPMNFAGLSGSEPSSGISILGGRSAFGALKRAAEEEAENDLAPKRAKLAEH